jgi:hypothetical protein
MTRLAPILAAAACALCIATSAEAGQSPYQVHVERQRGELLVIDHTPPARTVGVVRRTKIVRKYPARVRKAYRRSVVARYRDSALAGGCYDGGYVSGADARGNLYTLHRDICEGIAPTDRPYRFNRW